MREKPEHISKSPQRILFYDIETTPLRAWVWKLGEQVVRHGQLDPEYMTYDIICLSYCWNDGKPAKVLHWDYDKQDSSNIIAEFDKLIKAADVVIGKNSDRFDNKHINFHRMMNGGEGMPDWLQYTDDLERQLRKHFGSALPSQSLDYVSQLLGLGGKVSMSFDDWIAIVTKDKKAGPAAFKKMCKYNQKDVEDTRAIWNYVAKHITPKHNAATVPGGLTCRNCGSGYLVKDGTRVQNRTIYQRWFCNSHGGYAGRTAVKKLEKGEQMG